MMTLSPPTNLALLEAHNREAQAVWDAFYNGQLIRPPAVLGTATQFFIFNNDLNPDDTVTREANNLALRAPFENLNAMYQSARRLI